MKLLKTGRMRRMVSSPTHQHLQDALSSAGSAHHDYESVFFAGVRDEQWAGWYSAYVLGRLGDITTLTLLARWLQEVSSEGDWSADAAEHIRSRIGV